VKGNDTRRRARLTQTRKEIREVEEQIRMLGRELDDLRKVEAIYAKERKRRAPQKAKPLPKMEPLHKRKKVRTKGTKKRGKKPLNSSGAITTRGKLEDLFANKEVLTIGEAEKQLGINLRYHFLNLRDDKLIVQAGLAPAPKGGGHPEQRWRWVGPAPRELSVAVGAGTRPGRKKAATP
jgi:hypothetical protein